MASPRLALSPLSAPPSLRMELVAQQNSRKSKPKFDTAFIERRMRLHRKLQDVMQRELTAAIFDEVAKALEASR